MSEHALKKRLAETLATQFSDANRNVLLHELGVDPQDVSLGAANASDHGWKIVVYFEHRERLRDLADKVDAERPTAVSRGRSHDVVAAAPPAPAGLAPTPVAATLRVLVHDVLSPINVDDAVDALLPTVPIGPTIFVRPTWKAEDWGLAAKEQAAVLHDMLERSRALAPRFAVFSLSPIPLAVHLGFVLSDRVEVEPRQYDRVLKTWRWPDLVEGEADCNIRVQDLPAFDMPGAATVVIRVSISEIVAPGDTKVVVPDADLEIDIRVEDPNVNWLRSPTQLASLSTTFGQVLKVLRRHLPACRKIHVFYAGPTGGAVVLGQSFNPRMDPPVVTYEFSRRREPRYRTAITLEQA